MLPIFIGLTMVRVRDGKKIWINANCIGEIMDADAEDEDEEYAYMEGSTLVFIQGRPGYIRVKETPDEIRTMIRNAERDAVSLIVQRLHAQGFIGH